MVDAAFSGMCGKERKEFYPIQLDEQKLAKAETVEEKRRLVKQAIERFLLEHPKTTKQGKTVKNWQKTASKFADGLAQSGSARLDDAKIDAWFEEYSCFRHLADLRQEAYRATREKDFQKIEQEVASIKPVEANRNEIDEIRYLIDIRRQLAEELQRQTYEPIVTPEERTRLPEQIGNIVNQYRVDGRNIEIRHYPVKFLTGRGEGYRENIYIAYRDGYKLKEYDHPPELDEIVSL